MLKITARFRLLAVVGAIISLSCVDKKEAPLSKLAEGCLLNSQCQEPLVCVFRRCHAQCEADRDCPSGQRCAYGEYGHSVCLLPDEVKCKSQSCSGSLRCDERNECVGQCKVNADCLSDQRCENGLCVNQAAPPYTYVACMRDRECAIGSSCVANRCEVAIGAGGGSANSGGGSTNSGGGSTNSGGGSTNSGGGSTNSGGGSTNSGGGSTNSGGGNNSSDAGQSACRGVCNSGFVCNEMIQECVLATCAGLMASCAGACNNGQCFVKNCGPFQCRAGEVCDTAAPSCRSVFCAGVQCPDSVNQRCAGNGRCLDIRCATGVCGANQVCQAGICVHERCVDVVCSVGSACVAGSCLSTTTYDGGVCAPGWIFNGAACVEPSCEGVSCTAGSSCRAGQCVSAGIYVAGYTCQLGDCANSSNKRPLVVRSTMAGWEKMNQQTVPEITKMMMSPNGAWIYAMTAEGYFMRSTDGRFWQTTLTGQRNVDGALVDFDVDYATGNILAVISTFPLVGVQERVLQSVDEGSTWSTAFLCRAPFGTGQCSTLLGVSASNSFVSQNNSSSASLLFPRGVYDIRDGGLVAPFAPANTGVLFSDPWKIQPTLVSTASQLVFIDGGLAVSVAVAPGQFAYSPPPNASMFATAAQSVWRSSNFGQSWASRTILVPQLLRLSGIALPGASVVATNQYVNNTSVSEVPTPMIQSLDNGDTWTPVAQDWSETGTLGDTFNTWQPSTAYSINSLVVPSVPNGFVYVSSPSIISRTSLIEPIWPLVAGVTATENGADGGVAATWKIDRRIKPARLTAITSYVCGSGQLLCGTDAGCTDIMSNKNHCGTCNQFCNANCIAGRCITGDGGTAMTPGAIVGSGCADNTREGLFNDNKFADVAVCAGKWVGNLTDTQADSICAPGFHVCRYTDAPKLLNITFNEATSFNGCFAYRAANDSTQCNELRCAPGNTNNDDMAGLGRDCARLSGVSRSTAVNTCIPQLRIDAQCCAITSSSSNAGCKQRAEDGVVCCRD
jgi:hypothetical protein